MKSTRIVMNILALSLVTLLCANIALAEGLPASTTSSKQEGTTIAPGQLPTVKGRFNIPMEDKKKLLSPPTRISRQISYDVSPRNAYRSGNVDYNLQVKYAREQSRPVTREGPIDIRAPRRGGFAKNLPQLHPESIGSSLRPGSFHAAIPSKPKPRQTVQQPSGGDSQQ